MGREPNTDAARRGPSALMAVAVLAALALSGCSGNGLNMDGLKLNVPGFAPTKSRTAAGVIDADVAAANNDAPCPEVLVRTGAATLIVGDTSGKGAPSPMSVRYQGTIVRTARECHLNAGLLTVKVGVEGRIITGPAGGPGTVNVPLRIAVVDDTLNPTTIVTKFTEIPVTVTNSVDHVAFTHVEPDLSFPLPQPESKINNYVIFVGFDQLGAQQRKPIRRRHVRHHRTRR